MDLPHLKSVKDSTPRQYSLKDWGVGKKYLYDNKISVLNHIIACALENPEKIALVDSKGELSYTSLLNQVTSLTSQLKSLGIQKGDTVALIVNPSTELIVLILAILARGACFLAIDRNYPKDRIKYLLEDCKASLLILDQNELVLQAYKVKKNIRLENLTFYPKENNLQVLDACLFPNGTGENPAYTIYTSGSTGSPKGIVVPHRAICNHMLWMIKEFNLKKNDHFLLKTPLTFDPSIWEMFLPLMLGATLFIAPPGTHSDPDLIAKCVKQHEISVLQLVPVILHRLLSTQNWNQQLNSLRYLFVGGESLSSKTKSLFFEKTQDCRLINLYGPAEATIDTTFHEVLNLKDHIQHDYIGKPIYNTHVLVIDENGQNCPENEVGELVILGDGISLGYTNKALNQGKFVPISSETHYSELGYYTGDLVRWNHEGILEYVGRKDHQIKINGVRFEVDELKQALLSNHDIFDCKIILEKNNAFQFDLLSCYLLPLEGATLDLSSIKEQLKAQFPSYMLPHRYFVLNQNCLSPNGKIDLKKARNFIFNLEKTNTRDSKTESILREIWEAILSIPIKERDVNFFELGGESISTCILLSEIKKVFSIQFNISDVLVYPTLSEQARQIDTIKNAKHEISGSPIIQLNSEADEKCFLIHPIGGTVFWYIPLAKQLDQFIQIYGIQDPGILNIPIAFNSIQEIAEYYTHCILETHQSDHYTIGGASFGGTIAIEVAKKLMDKGKTISSIQIFDGWAIYPNELSNQNYFHESMQKQQTDWSDKFQQTASHLPSFEKLFEIQTKRLNLLFNYQMQPFCFKVDLYKAQKTMPIFQAIDDAYNHWDKYTQHINLHIVPGDHESMFFQDNVRVLAEKFRQAVHSLKK
jgi:amino acid adenylation domain-containing protein